MLDIDFPYHIDARGRTATTDQDNHQFDLLYQLLMTIPGERVNRPNFGIPLLNFTFEPNSTPAETSLQAVIQAAGVQWLADRIDLQEVEVVGEGASLRVRVKIRIKRTKKEITREFPLSVPEP